MGKWKPKSIYPLQQPRKKVKDEIKIPKVYRVNGYMIIGEVVAMFCREMGMKVEEIK